MVQAFAPEWCRDCWRTQPFTLWSALVEKPFYLKKIEEEFQTRIKKNPAYSLRAFARAMGLNHSVVSRMLKQKRSLPRSKGEYLAEKLNLSPIEKRQFLLSARLGQPNLKSLADLPDTQISSQILEEELHYRIISEWEYFAVFELLETPDKFRSSVAIAKRLGISKKRAEFVVGELLSAKLIAKKNGRLVKSVDTLESTIDLPSSALRLAHRELLRLGIEKIEQYPLDERYYSTMTATIDPSRLKDLRTLYREFIKKVSTLLEDGERTEVFQIGFHAFPLSDMSLFRKKGKNK